jgi:predicted AlkP superfamily pyrophosphatase or phosphodiesterase
MLGGHKSDLTLWFSKKKRQFVSSNYYGPLPAWVAYLNKDLAPSIPIWPKFGLTLLTPQVDDYVFAAAKRAIQEYNLGKDDIPDLLLVSFSATDNIGHWYGPNSDKMRSQLTHLDRLLGEFLGEIEKASRNDFVLLLTSDHGVLPVPESLEGKNVWAKRIPKKQFISECEKAIEKIYPGGPWIVLTLIPDIYFDKAKIVENKIPWDEFLSKAADQIRTVKDVAQVYQPPAFAEQDEYMSDYRRSYYPGRSGDLLIRMNAGALVTREKSGTDHGSPYEYDAHIPLLFYGRNIQPKTYYDPVSIEDIFPTCLDTLELAAPFPTSDPPTNRSLREIFSSQSK